MEVYRFLETVKKKTEIFLTWRKRRILNKKEKLKKKNVVADWVEAFLSAVVIVFFLNQYLLQAYQIPSQSMVHTLEIGDRIFVDKMTYGPELLPGVIKFPGFRQIRRGDIAIFESPEYQSKGTLIDIVTRMIYMMTFSFVDLDRDETGEPAKHFLIKRVPALGGDRLRMRLGLLQILPEGWNQWVPEEELKLQSKISYNLNKRILEDFKYKGYKNAAIGFAKIEAGLDLSDDQEKGLFSTFFMKPALNQEELQNAKIEIERVSSVFLTIEKNTGYEVWGIKDNFDRLYVDKMRFQALSQIRPYDANIRKEYIKNEIGRFIPEGFIFPMGDNRDNSRDARFFGPVKVKKVLGRSLLRFWPFDRFGGV
ncbi:MAG: signal peptidase I [Spirochaetales bacterium]|nr:signal peptidase I [Spirochaetales bacterium]